ncbi:Cytosol aminopeptidase PepA [Clostridiaceae bacterium JG1575]|nr:Cytosol aminopeptidase PepA [Clostridiaceae bacterium JG1575]
MKFSVGVAGDVTILPVLKDQVPEGHEELLAFLKQEKLFCGAKGEVYADLGFRASKTIWVGLGEKGSVDAESLKKSFFKVGKELSARKVQRANIRLPKVPEICYKRAAMACVEGLVNSAYVFDKYVTDESKKEKNRCVLEEVTFDVLEGKEDKIREALAEISGVMDGIGLTRELVEEPAEVMDPQMLARRAKEALEPLGVEVEIKGQKEIEALGMTAFLAVARGSSKEPQLIIMRWKGAPETEDVVGLVGKGLTYDSGGYAIKPAAGMVTMHTDMGGAGSVIGAMAAIAGNKVHRNVTAVVAACENMISGGAYKNGDIIPTMSGKTIEVINTDAEGRVTLADSIFYTATKENVSCLIDVATLTGAVVVALGHHYVGAVTNDAEMMSQVLRAAELGGDKIWELPATEEYKEMVKGERSDLLNSVKGGAGSITAGMFLEHFVNDKKWVHLDIAGTATNEANCKWLPKGATGIPVKTLYYFCKNELDKHCC